MLRHVVYNGVVACVAHCVLCSPPSQMAMSHGGTLYQQSISEEEAMDTSGASANPTLANIIGGPVPRSPAIAAKVRGEKREAYPGTQFRPPHLQKMA